MSKLLRSFSGSVVVLLSIWVVAGPAGAAPGESAVIEWAPATSPRIVCAAMTPRDQNPDPDEQEGETEEGVWSANGYCDGIGSNC